MKNDGACDSMSITDTPSMRIVTRDGGWKMVAAEHVTFEGGEVRFWMHGEVIAHHPVGDIERVELDALHGERSGPSSKVTTHVLLVEAVRREHPRAYRRWTAKEDAQLLERRLVGATLEELAVQHKRQASAVSARLVTLAKSSKVDAQ